MGRKGTSTKKAYATDPVKFKEALKKAYTNNHEKFREAKRDFMAMILKDLKDFKR